MSKSRPSHAADRAEQQTSPAMTDGARAETAGAYAAGDPCAPSTRERGHFAPAEGDAAGVERSGRAPSRRKVRRFRTGSQLRATSTARCAGNRFAALNSSSSPRSRGRLASS
jgi:hypothetical protein